MPLERPRLQRVGLLRPGQSLPVVGSVVCLPIPHPKVLPLVLQVALVPHHPATAILLEPL